jgi:hypothetical protein
VAKIDLPEGMFAFFLSESDRNLVYAALTNQAQASEETADTVENERIKYAFTREVSRLLDLRDRLLP